MRISQHFLIFRLLPKYVQQKQDLDVGSVIFGISEINVLHFVVQLYGFISTTVKLATKVHLDQRRTRWLSGPFGKR